MYTAHLWQRYKEVVVCRNSRWHIMRVGYKRRMEPAANGWVSSKWVELLPQVGCTNF